MSDASLPSLDGRPRGGVFKKLITWLLAAVLLSGLGFGAGLYYADAPLSPSQEVLRLIEKDAAEAAEEEETGPLRVPREVPQTAQFETSYYEFPDAFTTNLKGSRRFLQVGVGLSTQYDATVIANVERHAMALRSDMLAVISGFTEEEIEAEDGRARLSGALRETINARLVSLEGFGGIEDVFFRTFVLQ
jgi:flagellar FliL protein